MEILNRFCLMNTHSCIKNSVLFIRSQSTGSECEDPSTPPPVRSASLRMALGVGRRGESVPTQSVSGQAVRQYVAVHGTRIRRFIPPRPVPVILPVPVGNPALFARWRISSCWECTLKKETSSVNLFVCFLFPLSVFNQQSVLFRIWLSITYFY